MDADGMVAVPTRPGIGVTVDVDRIEAITIRSQVLSAPRAAVAVA
jgi:hypothetical protein